MRVKTEYDWEDFIEEHAEVKEWLANRPLNTRRAFANNLMYFCQTMKIEPEEWRSLDRLKARDVAWKYIKSKVAENPAVAAVVRTTLKSFYRNKDGEQLPFDSGRGGKHYFKVRRKKAAIEHIPNKQEMYQIVDMASSLRDKTLLLFLFQTGCRVNVLEHLTYGDVEDQLDKDTITLKITGELDHKLRGRDIPYYVTFLNGEGAETMKQYCKIKHKRSKPTRALFSTGGKKAISQSYIWYIVKMCAKRAGFNPKTIWTHTLRKAFRKIVRQANIDDDDKEQLMGHVIPGSREAYYDQKDTDLILKAYQKCNFTRELPESEVTKLRKQLEDSETRRRLDKANYEVRLTNTEKDLQSMKQLLKQLLEQK